MPPMSDDYNDFSDRQTQLWDDIHHLFLEAVQGLQVEDQASVHFCEFGCSTGRNSVAPLRALAAHVAGRPPPSPVLRVTLCDLPGTDWRTTFATVTPAAIASGLALDPSRVLLYGAPRSFYEAVLPPASLDFAYSLTSLHWLSQTVAPITSGGIHPSQETDPDLRERWVAQARIDWARFVHLRSKELRPNGLLVVSTLGRPAAAASAATAIFVTVTQALRALVDEGRLRPRALDRLLVPLYYRSPEEFEAPFRDPDLDLRLIRLATVPSPCPYWRQVEAGRMSLEDFAEAVWGLFYGVAGGMLDAVLDHLPPPDRTDLVAFLKAHVKAAVVEDPARHRLDYNMVFLCARKCAPPPTQIPPSDPVGP